MAYGKGFYRKRPKGLPQPYKSKFEYELHIDKLRSLEYEPIRIPYTSSHNYTPDFVNPDKGLLFEAKGRFESSAEAAKYLHVRSCNECWELIFIFQNPSTPMPNAKPRKDGSKFTHGEWATKNKFQWCCPKTIKKEWL